MILSQLGAAFACIGVALFEVNIAYATPEVYKSLPLDPRHLTLAVVGSGRAKVTVRSVSRDEFRSPTGDTASHRTWDDK